nr:hypothetical protein Iba_chr14aCG25900 [Ipomoea batatas]GME19376.1 hypothetical protein Iba_scaffold22682CG0010 [Ipomoea batatas]
MLFFVQQGHIVCSSNLDLYEYNLVLLCILAGRYRECIMHCTSTGGIHILIFFSGRWGSVS